MRVGLFATFISLATIACLIFSTQARMTAQQAPQSEAEYWLLLSAEAKKSTCTVIFLVSREASVRRATFTQRKSLRTFLTRLCRLKSYRKLLVCIACQSLRSRITACT